MLRTLFRYGTNRSHPVTHLRSNNNLAHLRQSRLQSSHADILAARSVEEAGKESCDAAASSVEPISWGSPPIVSESKQQVEKSELKETARTEQELDGTEELEQYGDDELRTGTLANLMRSPKGSHESVIRALESGDVSWLLQEFLYATDNSDYLATLPPVLALDVFKATDPSKFLDIFTRAFETNKYDNLHREKSEYVSEPVHITRVIEDLKDSFHALFYSWEISGLPLDLATLKSWLKVASVTGDGPFAERIFKSIMGDDKVVPDTEFFNLYFHAKCWHDAWNPVERGTLRVTDRSLFLRSRFFVGPTHGFRGHTTGVGGVKDEVSSLFKRMLSMGLLPNTDSFCGLMIAMAREGDLEGVAAVLKRAWEIDVEEIMASETDDVYFENDNKPESPLFPTQDLLFAIAHVYGTNNQISTALRLVDHVSRKFSLEISRNTWSELASWTFVLATERAGVTSPNEARAQRARERLKGKISPASFEDLWNIMIAEPYNVTPTNEMHNERVRSFWRRGLYSEMIQAIQEANKASGLENMTLSEYNGIVREYKALDLNSIKADAQEQARALDLIGQLGIVQTFQRWMHLLLRKVGFWDGISGTTYRTIVLPNVIDQFRHIWFNPRGICYDTTRGRIQFARGATQGTTKAMAKVSEWQIQAGQLGSKFTLVCHHGQATGKPFTEKSLSQKKQERHDSLVARGTHKHVEFAPAWYEMPGVGNWIWHDDNDGYRSGDPKDLHESWKPLQPE